MIFAKLFNLNDSDQLLVKRFYDTDTEMYVLSLETDLDDLIVKMEMRMSQKEACDSAFDKITEDKAQPLWIELVNLIRDKQTENVG